MLRAAFRRIGIRSTAVMSVAPKARAAATVTSPIGPAPSTTAVSPALSPTKLTACSPTASGSTVAPASVLTFSGSL